MLTTTFLHSRPITGRFTELTTHGLESLPSEWEFSPSTPRHVTTLLESGKRGRFSSRERKAHRWRGRFELKPQSISLANQFLTTLMRKFQRQLEQRPPPSFLSKKRLSLIIEWSQAKSNRLSLRQHQNRQILRFSSAMGRSLKLSNQSTQSATTRWEKPQAQGSSNLITPTLPIDLKKTSLETWLPDLKGKNSSDKRKLNRKCSSSTLKKSRNWIKSCSEAVQRAPSQESRAIILSGSSGTKIWPKSKNLKGVDLLLKETKRRNLTTISSLG